jgi:hypothetical protein
MEARIDRFQSPVLVKNNAIADHSWRVKHSTVVVQEVEQSLFVAYAARVVCICDQIPLAPANDAADGQVRAPGPLRAFVAEGRALLNVLRQLEEAGAD